MLGAVARRLATGALTLLLVTFVVFALVHASPGDPTSGDDTEDERLGSLTAQRRAELRSLYHLDEPIHRRYVLWLGDVVRGDLGRSFHDQRPVTEKIGERLGTTVLLNALALFLMASLALPAGGFAAWRPGSRWDRLSGLAGYALFSMPSFWAALLLQVLFAVQLGWLPLYGLQSQDAVPSGTIAWVLDRAAHLVLPVICLAYGGLAYLSRFVRASLLESAFGESARTARARGAGAVRLLARHGVRQAAIPMLTLAGFVLPGLVAGSVIVESVFAIQGVGGLFADAVRQRDLPVILGLTLLSGSATLAGVLLADVGYAAADPRVRRDAR